MVARQYQRSIYLVDAENMVGSCAPHTLEVEAAWHQVQMRSGFQDGDLVIVGSSSKASLISAYSALPYARHVFENGHDGADLALLEALEGEMAHKIADRIVLVSGDGIFAPSIAKAARRGFSTLVCAREDLLSKRLRLAAHGVAFLDPTDYVTTSARIVRTASGWPRLVAI